MDFTKLPTRRKAYGGANGSKLSVVYDDALWMLKLPSHAEKNPFLSYSNSSVSEYLGCHIFNLLGIPAQETMLGTYEYHDVIRPVVACKDFTSSDTVVMDFASVKNQIIDSNSNGYGTDIRDIMETIQRQTVMDPKVLSDFFWDMFIVDAFIGNWDRHNGNWGFLYNQGTDEISLAPIYDCGSSLYPQMDEGLAKKVLSSKKEMMARVYEMPTSAIYSEGKRINYFRFISSHSMESCDMALSRIAPRINMDAIQKLIAQVEQLGEFRKEFLLKILDLRKRLIIDANL